MAVINQLKSIRKDGISHILVLKTKRTYIVLDKATPSSYWLQSLPFCEGLWRPGRKVKEPAASMENIPSNMVLHNKVYGLDTIFYTIAGPLVNNPLEIS